MEGWRGREGREGLEGLEGLVGRRSGSTSPGRGDVNRRDATRGLHRLRRAAGGDCRLLSYARLALWFESS